MGALTGRRKHQVLKRDHWQCQMPCCLSPARRINPALHGAADEWAPTVDHVIRRADGGTNALANLRAAHWLCNEAAKGTSAFRALAVGAQIGADAARTLLALRNMLR